MSADPPVANLAFDFLRYSAATTLRPAHQEDFHRLVKLLRHAPGFQLLFARVADLAYRDALIASLEAAPDLLARPCHRINLSDEVQFPDFAALEFRLRGHVGSHAVVHLLNAGVWLQGANLADLNLRRNALASDLDAALVWWLPAAVVERVAQTAPDAWAWRSGVFDFIDDTATLAITPVEPRFDPVEFSSMTLAQRSQRLALLNQQLAAPPVDMPDKMQWGLLLERAVLQRLLGMLDDAETGLRERALALAIRMDDARAKAVTQGHIADILMARGRSGDALKIRIQEELPVYEKLGKVQERAIALGKIADILIVRGEFDEALRILTEQQLPLCEQLGDEWEIAVAMGKIADIFMARGHFEEALRIRTEAELPFYERFGDPRSRAITQGKIADILMARGQPDEALRLFADEVLPVFERLGDVRSHSVTQGKIADIFMARGQLDEAQAVLEARLPVAEQLGDIESEAHIRFLRARLRLQRGEHQRGSLQLILDDLARAYALAVRIGRAVVIGPLGALYGQILWVSGDHSQAFQVLDTAEAAFVRLGDAAGVERLREIRSGLNA